jgi:SAM-dependent methyltransferase
MTTSTPASPLATPEPWNLVAQAYEAEVVPQFEHFAREALRLAAPPAGSRVADVACGPGTLALLAAQAGFPVDALDFSTEMVDCLERRVRTLGVQGVTARVGDGQALPFESGAYGAAFSLFGLMFFPDRARGFAELRRILRPGARAVVSSWQPMERVPAMAAMFAALMEALPRPPGGGPPPSPPAPLGTVEACQAEMGKSFREVTVHPVSTSTRFASALALWESMERSMAPLVLMRRQMGEEGWAPLAGAGAGAVTRVLGPGPVTLEMHAWLTVGVAR